MANNTQNTLAALHVCATAMGHGGAQAPGHGKRSAGTGAWALLGLLWLLDAPLGNHGEILATGRTL